MIALSRLTFTYPDSTGPALQDISCDLPAGSFTLLMGRSGSGKSTLLRCLNGLVPHFTGGTLHGRILVNGCDPVADSPLVLSRHVGFVFQEPDAQFVFDVVEDEIAFALENAGLPHRDMHARVDSVLQLLGLVPLRKRTLSTLSGGERQRVAIASVLALQPRILVLDEPTAQLDPHAAEELLEALVRLNHEHGLTIVLAEHRIERILPFVSHILYLPDSPEQTLRYGPPRELLPDLDLVPPVVELARRLGWRPLPLTVEEARPFVDRMVRPEVFHVKQLDDGEPAVLTIEALTAGYTDTPILNGLSLRLLRGTITVLIGANGAGKTTLLKSIIGLHTPQFGEIRLMDESLRGREVAEICRRIGYLPQESDALLFADTVREELLVTLRNHGMVQQRRQHADTLLERLGLADKAERYPRDLSAGERQRVALGAITVTGPVVLLLDEPTRGLDYAAKRTLAELLIGWRNEGIAILLVTHDVEFAATIADRAVILEDGVIRATGDPRTVLGQFEQFAPQIARLFPGSGWLTVADVPSA